MVKNKYDLTKLQEGVRSILAKNGYTSSEEDKAVLEEILVLLEEFSKDEKGDHHPDQKLKYALLVMRLIEFFGVDFPSTLI